MKLKATDGIQFHIDVKVVLDCSITIYQAKDKKLLSQSDNNQENFEHVKNVENLVVSSTPLFHEFEEQREIIIRFCSPYFEPTKLISRENPLDHFSRIWNWNWRVADIDYLIASKEVEEYSSTESE